MSNSGRVHVQAFFDDNTFTITYVVCDEDSAYCAIIDSVLDYDPKSGRTSTISADKVIEFVQSRGCTVDWILETHAHADHITAAPYLKSRLGGTIAIGSQIATVQETFKSVFNTEPEFATDGSQFDYLFEDDEEFQIGNITAKALHTPGHTPACMTYLVADTAFVGDTLFMPDYGTARTDFPGGDATTLYQSIQRIFSLPETTRLFMCHDYLPPNRNQYAWETTVKDERDNNIHVGGDTTEAEFVAMRTARDRDLQMPNLILPSVQINMRAGNLPPAESNGVAYLKIPIDVL